MTTLISNGDISYHKIIVYKLSVIINDSAGLQKRSAVPVWRLIQI